VMGGEGRSDRQGNAMAVQLGICAATFFLAFAAGALRQPRLARLIHSVNGPDITGPACSIVPAYWTAEGHHRSDTHGRGVRP